MKDETLIDYIKKAIKESGVYNPLNNTITLNSNDIDNLTKKITQEIKKGEEE